MISIETRRVHVIHEAYFVLPYFKEKKRDCDMDSLFLKHCYHICIKIVLND